jgi:hypothetical protein
MTMKSASEEFNIHSRIILDSIGAENGIRLTTAIMTYPRFVHAEHMRHRSFSFCVASSRAIPSKKFATLIRKSPSRPVWWGKNQPGMKAREELTGGRLLLAKLTWELAKQTNLAFHFAFRVIGLHKQVANRILEAWMPVTVLVTGTDWRNFYVLRCHPDAQPEMCAGADTCLKVYCESEPHPLQADQWHLPFMDDYIGEGCPLDLLKKVSVARCARTSYLNHDGRVDFAADSKLTESLIKQGHWSPFEHIATPLKSGMRSGNFRGWQQYRKEFRQENPELWDRVLDMKELLAQRQGSDGSKFAI